jgi:AraC family transcriptional regulator
MAQRIETLAEKKFIGKRLKMSFIEDKTFILWRSFMPERKNVKNTLNTDLYSLNIYEDIYEYTDFSHEKVFEKWAAVEVSDFDHVPENMETYTLKAGLYAVFIHKGDVTTFAKTFDYIYKTWLPNSDYVLDNRVHFEILGEKYKNNDPESEEEIWIPIKKKV